MSFKISLEEFTQTEDLSSIARAVIESDQSIEQHTMKTREEWVSLLEKLMNQPA